MNKKLVILACLAFSSAALAGDYSSWAKYKNITLNTSGITTTPVVKIPVLVRFSVANQFDMFTGSTAALSSGADIRITKSDGTTDLPFEIDNWTTGANGSGAVWVLLDSVLQNNVTAYSFRVYWNKAGATTASNSAAVFAPSNGFLAVWHFNEASGSPLVDATGNGTVATPGSGAAPTDNPASVIGTGKNFDGASQYFTVGSDSTALSLNANNGPYTITAWANPASCAARIAVLAKYANDNSTGTRQYALQTAPNATDWRMTDDPNIPAFISATTNNEFVADAPGSCVTGSWTYLAGSYYAASAPTLDAAGAANVSISVNGGAAMTGVSANQGTGASIGMHANTFIGKLADNERYMNGSIDELTVSNVLRSTDWINLSYQTQSPTSTVVTVGASVPPTAILPQSIAAGFKIQSMGSSLLFQLPAGIPAARISVLDIDGRQIWSRNVNAGTRELSWDGKSGGHPVAAGIYLVRLTQNRTSKVLSESKITLSL